MLPLLVDRFQLAFHRESRELDGFALVDTGTHGPGLRDSDVDCLVAVSRSPRCREGGITEASLVMNGGDIASLVIAIVAEMQAPVVDATMLTGRYDIRLQWSSDATVSSDQPSMTTALREQLGLRLERRRVPVEMFIVDRFERPTPD